jgi:hypothetical protein
LTSWSGQISVRGGPPSAGSIELTDQSLEIVPQGGPAIHLALVDIEDVHDDNYTLRLTDHTGDHYDLSMFGRAYGQIVADLRSAREARLERDLLLRGVNLQDSFPGKLFGDGDPLPVEVRLYEDLMVVVPERHTMFGIPFSFIDRVEWDQEPYQTRVVTDDGIALTFGHLGRRSEEFRDELRRLLDALAARTARTLGSLLPGLDPGTVSRLAGLLRDGRAVQQRAVDAIDPAVWPRLEDAALGAAELRETYESLKGRTPPGWAAFGVKAVLTESEEKETSGPAWQPAAAATSRRSRSDWRDQVVASRQQVGPTPGRGTAEPGSKEATVTSDSSAASRPVRGTGASKEAGDVSPDTSRTDLWYFCPLSREGTPVNAVAQEVASEAGHATYLFRLMEPARFAALSGETLADEVGRSIARLNRALLQLNFRREPIYLPEEQLATEKYARYRVALRKLEYLRSAREAFLGRAVHNASWEEQVRAALDRA